MILKTNLKDYQRAAVAKLLPIKVGALYMEMGTGKTRTALELIYGRLQAGKIEKVLWLCPYSIKNQLIQEISKHCENWRDLIRICGIQSLSASVRINVDMLDYVNGYKTMIVVDESNLVKNFFAMRTKNIVRLAEKCPYRLILNGTPISKNEKDLFAQWYLLDWRILGYKSFWSFSANHLEYDERIRGRVRKVLNVDYLVEKISPYTYQVKKDRCLELPNKRYYVKTYHIGSELEAHYYDVANEFLYMIDESDSTTVYRLFSACQQVISGNMVVSKYKDPIKVKAVFDNPKNNPRIKKLLNIIEYDIKTDKCIIWCKYTHEIYDIQSVLGIQNSVIYCGKINKSQRDKAISDFENSKQFFIANKTCAGYGLNLQFCHNAIYYSNDWDYATRIQSEDRVHRMGQEKEVKIYDICADNTLDENIIKCLNRKENLVEWFKKEIECKKDKKAFVSEIIGGAGCQKYI
jgi:SNF2 family DNA or RNA helicase